MLTVAKYSFQRTLQSCHVLLIKCIWLADQLPLWAPLKKQRVGQFSWSEGLQTTRLLEQCRLDRRDQSRDVWSKCTASFQEKTKQSASAQTPHTVPPVSTVMEAGVIWAYFVATGPGHPAELLYVPTYSRVNCETICPTAKAWPNLGHAPEQWHQAQQQI